MIDPSHQLRLVLAPRLGDHRAQESFVHDDRSMVIQSGASESEQPLPIVRARQLLTLQPEQGASVITGELPKSERLARQLLVLDQCRSPPVDRYIARSEIWSSDTAALARSEPHRVAGRSWEEIRSAVQSPSLSSGGRRSSMIRASSAENWKNTSISKAVISRAGAADPKMSRASRPSPPSVCWHDRPPQTISVTH
jgi:hypothetical protein